MTQTQGQAFSANPVSFGASSVQGVLVALYAETPLHPGTGQSTGVIDLPVQRERHTGFPIIPATSLKGSLRAAARQQMANNLVDTLFGPEAGPGQELYAGALAFSDARLLAFPVRSLSDVFWWVTCPLAIARLLRDVRLAGIEPGTLHLKEPASGKMLVAHGQMGTIVLEDLSFQAETADSWKESLGRLTQFLPGDEPHRLYKEKFVRHTGLIADSDFDYLVQHATQVTARIALDKNTKTTSGQGGNLWYEESLPGDTVMYTVVQAAQPRKSGVNGIKGAAEVKTNFLEILRRNAFLQFGGNETVGYGWCALHPIEKW